MILPYRLRVLGLTRTDWRNRFVKLAALIWRRLMFRTTFIAVTGSVGKTTAKDLMAGILSGEGPTLATAGTSNTCVQVAETILRVRPRHRFAVLEVGTDRPGWIRRSAALARPDIALVLTVGRTHTDRFPTLDDTAKEKGDLVRAVSRRGVAVLNQDDPRVAAMAGASKGRVVRYGLSEHADVRGMDVAATWPDRLSLTLSTRGIVQRLDTRLVGSHWVTSVLGAVAVSLECGVSPQQIAERVAAVHPVPGRLDPCTVPVGAVILRDDYNGSLQTFEAAFQVLRQAKAARKILAITTVADSPESWDKRLRRIVCEAAGVLHAVVLVGEPDDTRRAAKAAISAGLDSAQIFTFRTAAESARFLQRFLQAGDVLLLRGRTTDHMARIFHAQFGEVGCWIQHCSKTILCENCPELWASSHPPAPSWNRQAT